MTNHGKATSRNPGYPDLGALANSKAGVIIANNTVWNTVASTAATMTNAGVGKVAVITRLVGSSQGLIAGTVAVAPLVRSAGSPAVTGDNVTTVVLNDAAGATTDRSFKFFNFDRNESAFLVGTPVAATNIDLVAPPDVPIDWSPRHPIVVPATWLLTCQSASATSNGLVGYGYIVDDATATSMGLTNTSTTTQTAQNLLQDGKAITNGTADMVIARTGHSIQILDLYVRLQPKTLATAGAAIEIKDEDGATIFKFRNDSRANCKEWKLSPGIFIKSGKKLTITGDAQSNGRGSVAFICKYVPDDAVPPNHFYGYISPTHASPAATTVATVGKKASTTITVTYPRLATTATTPGPGRRFHVEGICFSAQKDVTTTSDFVLGWVSTGTVTTGSVGLAGGFTVAADNQPLMPPQVLGYPLQAANFVVDQVNMPCVANTGRIFFETFAVAGTGLATPAATDCDVNDWGVTVWGRTLPTEQAITDTRQFTGE